MLGYLLIAREIQASIIRQSGVVLEGEQGKRHEVFIAEIVDSVQSGLGEVGRDDSVPASGVNSVSEKARIAS